MLIPEEKEEQENPFDFPAPLFSNFISVVSHFHVSDVFYQLAFFTPGIKPLEASSRNWIREMPN